MTQELKLILKPAHKRWIESGRDPGLFWHILPPLYPPYTTYGDPLEWPKPLTIGEAVDQLALRSSIGTKVDVLDAEEGERTLLNYFLGMWIRNNFDLWKGNKPLAKAIRVWREEPEVAAQADAVEIERLYQQRFGNSDPSDHPDYLSGPIIQAFWTALENYKWPELTTDWEQVRFKG